MLEDAERELENLGGGLGEIDIISKLASTRLVGTTQSAPNVVGIL